MAYKYNFVDNLKSMDVWGIDGRNPHHITYQQPQPAYLPTYNVPTASGTTPLQSQMYTIDGQGRIIYNTSNEPPVIDVFKHLPQHLRTLGREGAAQVIAEDDGAFIDFLDAVKLERVRVGLLNG